MNRRAMVSGSAALFLAACQNGVGLGGNAATDLATAKLYASDVIDALAAAAAVYVAQPNAKDVNVVNGLVLDLQTFKSSLMSLTDAGGAKEIIMQMIAAANQLLPLVTPYLGAAAPYVPLGVLVLEAFVQALPLPSGAGSTPPAALHRMALTYRHRA